MELWDVYDQHERFLHKTIVRGVPLKKGEYHLVVHIWTFSKGKLLVSKRSPFKPYPNMWEVTGGSVLANESPLMGACRELWEETGVCCQPEELKLSVTKLEGSAIYKSYILVKEIDEAVLRLQPQETIDLRFVSKAQWQQMMDRNEVAAPIVDHYVRYQKELECYFYQEDES